MWMSDGSYVCDCSDPKCLLAILLPAEVVDEVYHRDYKVLIDGCTTPIPDDATLIRKGKGYKIYKLPDPDA